MTAKEYYELASRYGNVINPFAATCQSYLETGGWSSELWLNAYNGAGIKARKDNITGGVYACVSPEQLKNGAVIKIISIFRRYDSPEEFMADYADKISRDYKKCSPDNLWLYFAGLYKGRWGAWATDQRYYAKLTRTAIKLAPSLLAGGVQRLSSAYTFANTNGSLTDWQKSIILKALS